MPRSQGAYIKQLKRRAKDSHVYRKYQLMGLEISQVLKDEKHKSLYIKLAKERNGERLLQLAKEIAENRNVKNRGAYFMAVLKANSAKTRASRPNPS
jgi:hypothetical protein